MQIDELTYHMTVFFKLKYSYKQMYLERKQSKKVNVL